MILGLVFTFCVLATSGNRGCKKVWLLKGMSGLGVCVSVVSGATVVVKERLLRVPDTTTLTQLLQKVKQYSHDELENITVQCSTCPDGKWMDTDQTNDVGLVVNDFSCKFIRYKVPDTMSDVRDGPPSGKRRCTIADVLMAVAKTRNKLPKPKSGNNSKEVLFNDVRAHLESRQVGFSASVAQTEGYEVINTLTNSLWAIDPNHDTLDQAHKKNGAHRVPKLPDIWRKFSGYNNYKGKKKAKPRLHSSELRQSAQDLFRIASRAALQSQAWTQTKQEIEGLAETLDSYGRLLEEANVDQQKRQKQEHPARQVADDTVIIHKPAGEVTMASRPLQELLKDTELYKPVFLGDQQPFFKGMNSKQRQRFLEVFTLAFPVDYLKYSPGGSVGNVVFIWQVPLNRSESQMMTDAIQCTIKLKPQLPEYHTRQQRIDFATEYGNVVKITPAIRRSLYSSLTGDATASTNPDMDEQLRLALLGESPDIVYDLRRLNSGRVPSFAVFFEEMGKVIEEWIAADERRHGVAHMSEYLSLPDLCAKVESHCPPESAIPSHDLVRLQFCPKRKSSHASVNFTGRFQVKYQIQVRQLRMEHVDDHYCAALFRYLREYAIKVRDHCTLVFADDKAKVDVGEPGAFVSTGVRGKKTLAPASSQLLALDHDVQSKSSLTPSVSLICDIPEDISGTFYRGDVHVCVKDAVFQASSPFRYAAELSQIMKRRGEVPPILFLYTDGGPDHRVTYNSVKCALICLFIELDLDFLVAARTAPGQSWTNPVERIMLLLNLALQNVAIARTPSENMEGVLRSCNSIADIRKCSATHPMLKNEWEKSLKPIIDLLNGRFQRLSLKGKPVHVEEYAEDAEINAVMQHLYRIDSTVDCSHSQQKDMDKYDKLKKFMEAHTRSRHYCFQIKKCDNLTCAVCHKK